MKPQKHFLADFYKRAHAAAKHKLAWFDMMMARKRAKKEPT